WGHEALGRTIPTMFQPASAPLPLRLLFPVAATPCPAGSVLSLSHHDNLHAGLFRASATPAGPLLTWNMLCQSELVRRHHEAGRPGSAEAPGWLVSSRVAVPKPQQRFGQQLAGAHPIPAPCEQIGAPPPLRRRATAPLPAPSKWPGRPE